MNEQIINMVLVEKQFSILFYSHKNKFLNNYSSNYIWKLFAFQILKCQNNYERHFINMIL